MNTCAVHSSGALLLEDERRLRDDTFKAPAPPDHAHRGVSLGGDRLLGAYCPYPFGDTRLCSTQWWCALFSNVDVCAPHRREKPGARQHGP